MPKDFAKLYRRRIALAALVPFEDIPHGRNGYSNYFCTCDVCKAAWAAYVHDQRIRRSLTPFDQIPHGEGGYTNYRCRCDVCRKGHHESKQRYRARVRARKDP